MPALSKNNCALEGRLLRPWSLLWLCGRVKCSGIVLQKCISALGNTEGIHTTTVTILWVKNVPLPLYFLAFWCAHEEKIVSPYATSSCL